MKTQNGKTTDEVTTEVMRSFNEAFRTHDISVLNNLIDNDCIMETAMPAPNGIKITGRTDCLAFWDEMLKATGTQFSPEGVTVMGEKAIIVWRYRWGAGEDKSVKGCSIMIVKNGLITEAVAYVKGALNLK